MAERSEQERTKIVRETSQDHLRQYATLQAMGYAEGYLSRVVLFQAVIMAVAGYLPGVAAAWALYQLTTKAIAIPVDMNLHVPAALVLGFCVGVPVVVTRDGMR